MYLGMSQEQADDRDTRGSDEGGKLKEAGTENWHSPNTGATNESGFAVLPGGFRSISSGNNLNITLCGYFWSSTEHYSNSAWCRILHSCNSEVSRVTLNKKNGLTVRCVRD